MLGHADRTHPWTTTAMRDAKGFVQVQMTNVRADVGRPAKADLGVQVRPVHIDLSAEFVDDVANLLDALLEHSVRGGIRHHQAGEVVAVRFGFGAQVRDVDVALLIAGDGDDAEPGHGGAGGIGAVRGGRDQADVPVRFAAAFVISADDEQSGVFTL